MLRINLLPAYIAERRKTRAAIAGFSFLFVAVTVLMVAWFVMLQTQTVQREADADEQQRLAEEVARIGAEAGRVRAEVAPIMAKKDFVDAVLFYNTLRPRIYRQVASYTHRNIEYNQMGIQGQTLNVQAHANNVSDVGRYLITMFANPDLSAVSVAGIPGWPPPQTAQAGPVPGQFGAAGYDDPDYFDDGDDPFFGGQPPVREVPRRPGFPFTMTAQLIKPVAPPAPPGTDAPATPGFDDPDFYDDSIDYAE